MHCIRFCISPSGFIIYILYAYDDPTDPFDKVMFDYHKPGTNLVNGADCASLISLSYINKADRASPVVPSKREPQRLRPLC